MSTVDPYAEIKRLTGIVQRFSREWPALHWEQVPLERKRRIANELQVLAVAAEDELRELQLGLRKWL